MNQLHPIFQQALAPWIPASNDTTGRQWVVKVAIGGKLEEFELRAVSSMDAWGTAVDRYPQADAIRIRPVIEITEGEGRARYPEALHELASADAMRGWLAGKQWVDAWVSPTRDDICTGHGRAYRDLRAAEMQGSEFPR